MLYLASLLLVILAVALDQLSKWATVSHLALWQTQKAIPGLFHFTHVRNEGMSFSMLSGARWLFVVVTILVILFVLFVVWRKWIVHPLGLLSLAAVIGGAIGNLIDRIRLGYVVDMIEVEFIRFAVFNVADIFVVVGGIAFIVYGIFFWEEPHERGRGHDAHC